MNQGSTARTTHEAVVCLGCGCACDDIDLVVENGGIVEAVRACSLGREWFGDGARSDESRVDDAAASVDGAVAATVERLRQATRVLVYLAPDVSCEAQRLAAGLADRLHGVIDSVSSATVLPSILAAQERGRATATLGEIRNRADVVVFWGVDPLARYPRYPSRYAPEPAGLHVAAGRQTRRVIAIDIGDARGPADADLRIAIDADDEIAVLTLLAAIAARCAPGSGLPAPEAPPAGDADGRHPAERAVAELASAVIDASYMAIVADAEPTGDPVAATPARSAALIALAQQLNGPMRCALSLLRAGGNRNGADAVLTAQTGFPLAVDFATGVPVYTPYRAAVDRLRANDVDCALVIGSADRLPVAAVEALRGTPVVLVGPLASRSAVAARVVIDTGMPGIHECGTAMRLDDVALPLRAPLSGGVAVADVLRSIREQLDAHRQAPNSASRDAQETVR